MDMVALGHSNVCFRCVLSTSSSYTYTNLSSYLCKLLLFSLKLSLVSLVVYFTIAFYFANYLLLSLTLQSDQILLVYQYNTIH